MTDNNESFVPGATFEQRRPTVEFCLPKAFAIRYDENGNKVEGIVENRKIYMPLEDPSPTQFVEHVERCEKSKGMYYVNHYNFPGEYHGSDSLEIKRHKAFRDIDEYLTGKKKHEPSRSSDNNAREIPSAEGSQRRQGPGLIRARAKAGETS